MDAGKRRLSREAQGVRLKIIADLAVAQDVRRIVLGDLHAADPDLAFRSRLNLIDELHVGSFFRIDDDDILVKLRRIARPAEGQNHCCGQKHGQETLPGNFHCFTSRFFVSALRRAGRRVRI